MSSYILSEALSGLPALMTGPFRWVIYEGQGGRLLATSESFYLPASAEQRFWIEALSVAP